MQVLVKMQSVTILLISYLVFSSIACDRKADVSPGDFVESLISLEPLYEDWQEAIEVGEPQFFGVEDPADHPMAWISLTHLAPGLENGIFVIQDGTVDVKLLHPEKGVVTTYGQGKGSGPGEFLDPKSSVWVPDIGILVNDYQNHRITIFTEAGGYIRDIQLQVTCRILAFSNSYLWAIPGLSNVIDRAFILDIETGNLLREVGGRYENAHWSESFLSSSRLTGSPLGILLSVKYPYEVHAYDSNGDLKRIFGREVKWLGPPEQLNMGSLGSTISPKGGQVSRACYFPNGFVMVKLVKAEPIGSATTGFPRFDTTLYFDLFTQNGEWLTTIPGGDLLPDLSIGAWTIASDGAFWGVIFGDYHRIVRLQLSFKQK